VRDETTRGGTHGEVEAEVFNGSGVVQRGGKGENKDDTEGDGSEFQEILCLDAVIFAIFTVREYRNGKF